MPTKKQLEDKITRLQTQISILIYGNEQEKKQVEVDFKISNEIPLWHYDQLKQIALTPQIK